jgi:hypothetical protein
MIPIEITLLFNDKQVLGEALSHPLSANYGLSCPAAGQALKK